MIKLAVGTDHRGFLLKDFLIQQTTIGDHAVQWIDCGAYDQESSDYPLFAHAVCTKIREDAADKGILFCATGIGMAIAANRFPGIYAGLAWNVEIARLAREDDNCNVLVLPSDWIDQMQMITMINGWLTASFKAGKYAKRLEVVDTFGS